MNWLTSLKWFESKWTLSIPKCLSTDSAKSCALSALVLATLLACCRVGWSRWPFGLRKFLILRQDSLESVSKLMELQNFSQLACDSILRSSLTCFCNWLIRVFTAGSFLWEYCLLSLRVSLISANVSLEIGLLSGRTLWDFGMALSTAVCNAVIIKSAYLSKSLVDKCPVRSAEPSASSSTDSNTSRWV